MQWGRQVPSWLTRRRYFRRFGPLLAPRRHAAEQAAAQAEPAADAPASNVLPFPGPAAGERRAEPADRDRGSA